ncbi:TPA: hypothetical protein I9Y49_001724 [Citrobacter koseri]|nr:hypothetical protein [Citrobacter koseri]
MDNKNLFYFIRIFQFLLKFGLILFIPNFLNTENLGYYSYINTVTNVFIILFGMELWYFYNREITTAKNGEYSEILSEQYAGYIVFYIILLPLLIIFFHDFTIGVIVKAGVLAILSHWVQEINRNLIYLSRLTEAAVINIVQSGWVVLFVFAKEVNINQTLNAMITALFVCVVLGRFYLPELKIFSFSAFSFFSLKKLYLNLIAARWLFISSISMRLAVSLPVLYYKSTNNIHDLAIFTYFYAIGTGIEFFIYHFVQAKFMGRLLQSFVTDINQYKKIKKSYFIQNSVLCCILLCGVVGFSYEILPYVVKNRIITESVTLGVIVIVGIAIVNVTNYYSVILYSQKKDISNIFTPTFSLFLSLIIVVLLYFLKINESMLGYLYFLIFSIVVALLRLYFWYKYDEQKIHISLS